MAKKTTTGSVLEAMVLPALEQGGYRYEKQVEIGKRPHGSKHIVDIVATDQAGKDFLISLKWQQVSGTTEQKIPWEVICLGEASDSGKFQAAYLVLGGPRWTMRDFYVDGGLSPFIPHAERVQILNLEDFIALANNGRL